MPLLSLLAALSLLLSLYTSAEASDATSREHIVFSCWIPSDVSLYRELNQLLTESFDALGYDFRMHHRPNQRALMEANAGVSDGECARTRGYGDNTTGTNLLRINALIARTSLEAWSHDPELVLNNEQALTTEGLRIGYVRGHVGVKDLMERLGLDHLISVTSTKHGLKMVSAKRLDVFIGTSVSTRQEMVDLSLERPVHSAGHVMDIQGYAYLHKKHADLLPELAEEMRKRLPEDGWRFDP